LVINVNKELSVSLRSNDTQSFSVPKTKSEFGDMTFKNFFSRFLNKLNFSLFSPNFEKFKQNRLDTKEIYNDSNIQVTFFLFILKFLVILCFFFSLCSFVYTLWISLCFKHLILNKIKKKKKKNNLSLKRNNKKIKYAEFFLIY
jgi:hypothetical protein